MAKAVWNGKVLAESEETVRIEGNHYFPRDSVNWEYFEDSNSNTFCSWKGKASYYNIKANDNENKDAADKGSHCFLARSKSNSINAPIQPFKFSNPPL